MTQTLRRELIQTIQKELVDVGELTDGLADRIADAVLKVSGIANSPAARKFNDPLWDLLHGGKVSEDYVDMAKVYTDIGNRLEKGLRRGEFPQNDEAQKVYRWIWEREQAGEKLDKWMDWAMDGKRADYSFIYHKDPKLIKRDWMQVFSKPVKATKKFETI